MSDYENLQVVAFDIGGTKIAGGFILYAIESEENGVYRLKNTPPRVAAYSSIPSNARRGGDEMLDNLTRFVQSYIDPDRGPLMGIGIASAGIINPQTGEVSYSNDLMPGWTGKPLKAHMEKEIGFRTAVLGDVQGHALGEARWGAAHDAESCLCVGIGTGIGGAFVWRKRVMRGFRGAAGHIGHTLHPQAASVKCACGKLGHIESIASGVGLSARYQGILRNYELDPARMGDFIARQAEMGDSAALEVLDYAGFALGESIGSWCNIFDPELVVLSGSVTQAGDQWFDAVKRGFASQAIDVVNETKIVHAELGGHAALVGAAELLLDELQAEGIIERELN